MILWKQVKLLNWVLMEVREAGNMHEVSWKGSEDAGVGTLSGEG